MDQNPPPIIPVAHSKSPLSSSKVWMILAAFFFVAAILITYQSQQSKIDRLNKQISGLKTEVKALGGNPKDAKPSADLPVIGDMNKQARDSKRQADLGALQTQLEVFYQNNGYYPSLSDINNAAWRSTNMKTLDSNALVDPANSTSSTTLVQTPTAGFYAYEVKAATGGSCEKDDTTCAQYDLTATFESTVNGSKTYTKSNLD